MDMIDSYGAGRTARGDALVETLVAPGQGSFVDALLALADETGGHGPADDAQRVLNNALQAALARKMRAIIDSDSRDAA